MGTNQGSVLHLVGVGFLAWGKRVGLRPVLEAAIPRTKIRRDQSEGATPSGIAVHHTISAPHDLPAPREDRAPWQQLKQGRGAGSKPKDGVIITS